MWLSVCVQRSEERRVVLFLRSIKSFRYIPETEREQPVLGWNTSLTVSVVAQKKAADSTYPMGIDRWNATSWYSSGVAFGTRNATDGMSSRQTHMRMYASARSTLLRKVGPSLGGAASIHSIILWSAFLKRIAFLWATWVTASLSPLQEKS